MKTQVCFIIWARDTKWESYTESILISEQYEMMPIKNDDGEILLG